MDTSTPTPAADSERPAAALDNIASALQSMGLSIGGGGSMSISPGHSIGVGMDIAAATADDVDDADDDGAVASAVELESAMGMFASTAGESALVSLMDQFTTLADAGQFQRYGQDLDAAMAQLTTTATAEQEAPAAVAAATGMGTGTSTSTSTSTGTSTGTSMGMSKSKSKSKSKSVALQRMSIGGGGSMSIGPGHSIGVGMDIAAADDDDDDGAVASAVELESAMGMFASSAEDLGLSPMDQFTCIAGPGELEQESAMDAFASQSPAGESELASAMDMFASTAGESALVSLMDQFTTLADAGQFQRYGQDLDAAMAQLTTTATAEQEAPAAVAAATGMGTGTSTSTSTSTGTSTGTSMGMSKSKSKSKSKSVALQRMSIGGGSSMSINIGHSIGVGTSTATGDAAGEHPHQSPPHAFLMPRAACAWPPPVCACTPRYPPLSLSHPRPPRPLNPSTTHIRSPGARTRACARAAPPSVAALSEWEHIDMVGDTGGHDDAGAFVEYELAPSSSPGALGLDFGADDAAPHEANASLHELEEQRDIEQEEMLEEQIKAFERIDELEDEVHRAKRQTHATSAALADEISAHRATRLELEALRSSHAAAAESRGNELAAMRGMFMGKLDAARQDLANTQRMHGTEVSYLYTQIDDFAKQVDVLSWTETNTAEAQSLDSEQLFARALTAETDSARRGLLGVLVAGQSPTRTEWFTCSAWPQRICRHIEDVRGGRGSAHIARTLAADSTFAASLLASPVFERFVEVLCLWKKEPALAPPALEDTVVTDFMTPADIIGLIESQEAAQQQQQQQQQRRGRGATPGTDTQVAAALRFSRGQPEWAKLRLDLAHALLLCVGHAPDASIAGADADASIATFVSTPAPLQLLALLARQECSLGATANTGALAAAARVYCAIAERIPFVAPSLKALWGSGAVGALSELMRHDCAVVDSAKALKFMSFDVASQEKLLVQGCLGPVLQCLQTWAQRIGSSAEPHQGSSTSTASATGDGAAAGRPSGVATEMIELLGSMSRAQSFQEAFAALGGVGIVVNVLSERVSGAAATAGVEILVNALHTVDASTDEHGHAIGR